MKKQAKKQAKSSEEKKFSAQQKYKYFKTLWDSTRLVFKNPAVLAPFIIAMLTGIASLPFLVDMQDPQYLIQHIPLLITFYVTGLIITVIIYGWTFSMINQLLTKNKAELGSSFKRSLSFGLRLIGINILVFLSLVAVYAVIAVVIALLIALSTIQAMQIAAIMLGIIIGALFLVFLFLYMTATLQLMPALIIEDKGVIETIRTAARFYLKKKLFSMNIFLVSLLSMIILSIPLLIYQYNPMMSAILTGEAAIYTLPQMLIMQLLSIIPSLFFAVILVYYAKSYMMKKETLKKR